MDMARSKLFTIVLALFVFACSRVDSPDPLIADALANQIDNENYELIGINYLDTLTKKVFLTDLSVQINEWKNTYQAQLEEDFAAAFDFFNQEHVKHLHERKLAIEDLLDSVALIHEHHNSFVNEREINGQYLNQLASLEATRKAMEMATSDIIWIVLKHEYRKSKEGDIQNETLFYFPEDTAFMTYNSLMNALEVINQHKFEHNLLQ